MNRNIVKINRIIVEIGMNTVEMDMKVLKTDRKFVNVGISTVEMDMKLVKIAGSVQKFVKIN
jgi:hypothetical protein